MHTDDCICKMHKIMYCPFIFALLNILYCAFLDKSTLHKKERTAWK